MKLKLVTAALVLATSGSAHALIIDGASDNGELFMTLLNRDKQISYVLDLNLRLNDLLAGTATGQTYTYAADANMVSFLAMSVGDPLVWAMAAADTAGSTAANYYRAITTANVINPANTQRNLDLKLTIASADKYLGDVNADIGDNASLIITDPARVAYAGSATWGARWGGYANWTATGPIGAPMDLYLVRQSSGTFADRLKPSTYQQLTYGSLPYQATLDMGGNLRVAPVPEPETYALMLAGLGLVGWMARRRKKA